MEASCSSKLLEENEVFESRATVEALPFVLVLRISVKALVFLLLSIGS